MSDFWSLRILQMYMKSNGNIKKNHVWQISLSYSRLVWIRGFWSTIRTTILIAILLESLNCFKTLSKTPTVTLLDKIDKNIFTFKKFTKLMREKYYN